ncbi:hypothetical protein [Sinorhizobium meliloti]|uniref:hypothetical protein n=1 Tax=Rhizobium meliloti TaxID=382 RepID=UPI000FD1D15C|nr:hypothetical protein [Sinorhizobium meliloti]RVM09361.1 hypothetical protein CN125_14105 [Sinorhizobium meliloti]RVM49999.1 hypothetical protein CN121_07475 [Sinorhizobium meliloti]RVM66782.1 hypothetical protein CN124_13390 [Sinorhizobium meliloti]RVM72987.1 hypothetical protein CN123_02900 [Sinorhizobium meliloti]RVM87619.1 hypothetical protein CN117_05170 [Sinorhizobium meliloti]
MRDLDQILDLVESCDDPERLRSWIKNAQDKGEPLVADAAFRRLVSVLPKEKPGSMEHDFWQTIHAFESLLSEERGKTTRLARTRQKVARVGEARTLQDWAVSAKSTNGFTMLLERKMPELTGEAIILRHAHQFDVEVVEAARRRLEDAGVDLAVLPGAMPAE